MKQSQKMDGFTVDIITDDQCDYIARFLEYPSVSAFSDTPEKAAKELTIAWDNVKQGCIDNGYSVPTPENYKS